MRIDRFWKRIRQLAADRMVFFGCVWVDEDGVMVGARLRIYTSFASPVSPEGTGLLQLLVEMLPGQGGTLGVSQVDDTETDVDYWQWRHDFGPAIEELHGRLSEYHVWVDSTGQEMLQTDTQLLQFLASVDTLLEREANQGENPELFQAMVYWLQVWRRAMNLKLLQMEAAR